MRVMPRAIRTLPVVPSFWITAGAAASELKSCGWLELYWYDTSCPLHLLCW